ncbi:MAG: FtsX-like permease family protein [Sporomusaceae bacterium]|nr:FtsX-like permease family protein [Sporomusaceae bacterium]
MGVLWHKLARAITETAGQFAAMAVLIALGVGCYYGMNLALSNLTRVQADFYQDTRAADHYFHVQRAPVTVLRSIESLPGVEQVTGRIQEDVKVMEDGVPRGVGRMLSFEPGETAPVNGFCVVAGPVPTEENLRADFGIKAYVDSQYFAAHRLQAGAELSIMARKRQALIIVEGAATSPDYLFKMRSDRDFPDRRDFAVFHVPRRNAEKILDMEGEVNQVLVRFSGGANALLVADSIRNLLEPYGLVASYASKEQASVKHVASQIDGLRSSTAIVPTGFFAAAAGIMYMCLHRYISLQQRQIGVMKALGCETRTVTVYFAAYALAVTLAGMLLGLAAGSVLGADSFATFAGLLALPGRYEATGPAILAAIIIGSVLAGIGVSLLSARKIAGLQPSEALSAAVAYNRSRPNTAAGTWQQGLFSSWKMTLRSIARNRGRFAVTATGLTVTVAMLVLSLCYLDSRHYLSVRFFTQENRYDYYVGLNNAVKSGDVLYLRDWDGIRDVEPVLEINASFSPLQREGAQREPKEGVIFGVNPAGRMLQPFNAAGRALAIPEEGILLNSKVAEKLGLSVGDRVQIRTRPLRGDSYQDAFRVVGIAQQDLGGVSFMSQAAVQRLVRERDAINVLLLKTDRESFPNLELRLLAIPEVAYAQSKAAWVEIFAQLVGSMTYFTCIMIAIAGLLGVTIVFLTSVLNLSDRQRELATLRVIGWSLDQVAVLLFNEIVLTLALALLLGFPLGKSAGFSFLTAASNESFTWPLIVYPSTYFIAAGLTALFAVAGHLLAMLRIKHLSVVEVLNNRD